ncbi:hypothetical protein OH77DRAFT_1421675 [Trametes cingulata]|nr:hypothetical protein OH77DRAFT_1421675 [Trametes cingulata]
MAQPVSSTSPSEPNALMVAPLDNTYGAYLLGTFLSLTLFGLSLHQLYRYIRVYWSTDPASIRSLVAVVMTLETLHIFVLMHSCYYYLVSNYFKPEVLSRSVWSMLVIPVITAWITTTSQIFFARRVALIGLRYRILVAICAVALVVHMGFSVAITALGFRLGGISEFQSHHLDWMFAAATGCAAIADAVLSTAIILAVRQSRANYQRDDGLFEKVMLYVVRSGLLTGVFNCIPSFVAIPWPRTFIWVGFSFVGARLYATTLLAVLNSRQQCANRGMEIFASAVSGRDIFARANRLAAAERWNAPQLPEEIPTKITINVSEEREMETPGRCGIDTEQDLDNKVYDIGGI